MGVFVRLSSPLVWISGAVPDVSDAGLTDEVNGLFAGA